MLRTKIALLTAVAAVGATQTAAALAADHPPLDALTQLPGAAGCLTAPDARDDCARATGIADVYRAAVSPDGATLYAATNTWDDDRLLTFRTTALGGLEQLPGAAGCYASGPVDGCTELAGVDDLGALAVAPDGRFLYALGSAGDTRITTFARDTTTGALTRVAGDAGCVRGGAATADCRAATGLSGAQTIALSPDGTSLYVPFNGGRAGVTTFTADPGTGRLSQGATPCVVDGAATADCAAGRALVGAFEAAVSPDGRHVYVDGGGWTAGASSSGAGTVAVFARGADGALAQLPGTAGCVRGDTGATAGCATVRGLKASLYGTPMPLALSPDGRSLYLASATEATLTVLTRDPASGALSQPAGAGGCLIDGPVTESCGATQAMGGMWDLEVSPDGRTLVGASYTGAGRAGGVGNDGGAIVFDRAADGTVSRPPAPFACVTSWTTAVGCSPARALTGVATTVFAPDGGTVWAGGLDSETIAVLTREAAPTCAGASAVTTAGRAVELDLRCTEPNGQPLTRVVTSGPRHGTVRAVGDARGTVLYTPDAGYVGGDAIAFRAGDGAYESAVAEIAIDVRAPEPGPEPRREPEPGPGRGTPPAGSRLTVAARGTVKVDARGRAKVALRCDAAQGVPAATAPPCTATATVRSAKKVRLTPRGRARIATLAPARPVTVPAGARATTTMTLTRQARALLRRSRTLRAVVAAGGAKATVTLKAPAARRR